MKETTSLSRGEGIETSYLWLRGEGRGRKRLCHLGEGEENISPSISVHVCVWLVPALYVSWQRKEERLYACLLACSLSMKEGCIRQGTLLPPAASCTYCVKRKEVLITHPITLYKRLMA